MTNSNNQQTIVTNIGGMSDNELALDLDHTPPVYAAAISQPQTSVGEENPPSYDSLFSKLRRAREESSNPVEYVASAVTIICGSFVITIIFAVSVALPITMVVIGSVYKDRCPIEYKIPIWLIVSGVFGCLSAVFHTVSNCWVMFKKRKDPNYQAGKKSCVSSIIELFLFAWFVCGNIWVYPVRSSVSFDFNSGPNYCHPTCYLFTFWIITISWILLAVACCCCCCILLSAGCGMGLAAIMSKEAK